MKRLLLFIFLIYCSNTASAQYNYYKFSLGAGAGVNQYYGDLVNNPYSKTFFGSLDYNITPFVSAGIEIQKGTITGGGLTPDVDQHLRFFENSYTAAILNGKIQLGQVVDIQQSSFMYALRGAYAGTGLGMIMNNMTKINRTKINPDGRPYTFPGVDKSNNLLVPAIVGIKFDIADRYGFTRYVFNIGYQLNITFGEGIDGYNDPPAKFNSGAPDLLGVTTVGFKICFGPEGLY